MPKRESVHPALIMLVAFLCLLLAAFLPLSAEDKANGHAEKEEKIPLRTEIDALSSKAILSPSLSFPLIQIIEETPYAFEIRPFQLEDGNNALKSDIQSPGSMKLNRFERTAYTASLVTLTALNIADALTTLQALKYDGLTEGNPVMKPFVNNVYLFTAVKLGVTTLNYYLLKKLHKKNKTLAWVLSMTANLVMSYVVANNIQMIRDARAR